MLVRTIYERIQMNLIVNLKEIGQNVMRAQVATFAGWPMPSQFSCSKATKKKKKEHFLRFYLILLKLLFLDELSIKI
jgi:hypothetical protein